ncbi:MAG: GNAT family N-acetyltransferase [Pseudomonadota bacterium]
MKIRKATASDRQWIVRESEPIGGPRIVSRGVLRSLQQHNAIVALRDDRPIGFAVYRTDLPIVELLGLRALDQWRGTGTGLLRELEARAKKMKAESIVLPTTNDNLSAIRFYQRRGYCLKSLNAGEFRRVLALKGLDPDLTVVGQDGIIIRDEIVLEKCV